MKHFLPLIVLAFVAFGCTDTAAQQTWVGSVSDAGRLATGWTSPACPNVADTYRVTAVDQGATWAIGPECVPTGALALGAMGVTQIFVPFKGGTLIPSPDFTFLFVTTSTPLIAPEPTPALPPGVEFYIQFWVQDSLGPAGAGATETLSWMST